MNADLVYRHERALFRIAATIATLLWLLLLVGTVGVLLFYAPFIVLFVIFAHSAFITHMKGNGVKITAEQYPDLHARVLKCCERLQIRQPPDVYLLRTDFFNALATRFLSRNFIVLFTDVVDALEDRPGAVDFYIGHELGHIDRGHLRYGWYVGIVGWIPLLGAALRRAQEYTCDRYGTACCDTREDLVAALAAISAGDTRWRTLNVDAYLRQIEESGGFWMSYNEYTGDYPWLSKRMAQALSMRGETVPAPPRRSVFALLLAAMTPRVGGAGGGASILVVVAVIGILAAIAIPAYQDFIERGETARALQDGQQHSPDGGSPDSTFVTTLNAWTAEDVSAAMPEYRQLTGQVAAFHDGNGRWPENFTELGRSEYSTLYTDDGRFAFYLETQGVLVMDLDPEIMDAARYLVMEPVAGPDGVEWYCYGDGIEAALVPAGCDP